MCWRRRSGSCSACSIGRRACRSRRSTRMLDFVGLRNDRRFPNYARLELGTEYQVKILGGSPGRACASRMCSTRSCRATCRRTSGRRSLAGSTTQRTATSGSIFDSGANAPFADAAQPWNSGPSVRDDRTRRALPASRPRTSPRALRRRIRPRLRGPTPVQRETIPLLLERP